MKETGGSLYLSGTGITSLPEGLTVGGSLYLSGTDITKKHVLKLKDGDYKEGRYLYADGILTHVKKRKRINGYSYFVGKIPGRNVLFDGKHYVHCSTFREGITDLLFKAAKDRGAEQYRGLPLDTELTVEEAVTMYRIITGACKQGSERFVQSLGDKLKEKYTIRECIELTRGQYNAKCFEAFFSA